MSKCKLVCKGDNILFALPGAEQKKGEGKVILSDEDKAQRDAELDIKIVEVLSVGSGVHTCEAGDNIMLRNNRLAVYEHEGVRYGGVSAYDVFCVVED